MLSVLKRPHLPKLGQSRLAGVRNAISPKPLVISVMGGPGSGKGTQCMRLISLVSDASRQHPAKARLPSKIHHINVGLLLREEATNSGSMKLSDGRTLAAWLADGLVVPSSVSIGVIKRELARIQAEATAEAAEFAKTSRPPLSSPYSPAVLLDGFPRSAENLTAYEQEFGPLDGMVLLDTQPRTMLSRVTKRSSSGLRRSDDGVVQSRVRNYVSTLPSLTERFTTVPMLTVLEEGAGDLYGSRTLRAVPLCVTIDGNGDLEEVQAYFRAAVATVVNRWY
jgi:UMP-CMP kinase